MTTHGMSTPGEVDVARDWLVTALYHLDGLGPLHPPLTVTDPFDATNNQTYYELVQEAGPVPTQVAVAFASRRATWELMGS